VKMATGCSECAARLAWKKIKPTYKHLLKECSKDEKNEDVICALLDTLEAGDRWIINKPLEQDSGSETMLMWAIWNLKVKVVKHLVSMGADTTYENETGHSASNYWNVARLCFSDCEEAGCEIAEVLYDHGARLSVGAWNVAYMAKSHGFSKLIQKLTELYARERKPT
jgi:hypothetical protein